MPCRRTKLLITIYFFVRNAFFSLQTPFFSLWSWHNFFECDRNWKCKWTFVYTSLLAFRKYILCHTSSYSPHYPGDRCGVMRIFFLRPKQGRFTWRRIVFKHSLIMWERAIERDEKAAARLRDARVSCKQSDCSTVPRNLVGRFVQNVLTWLSCRDPTSSEVRFRERLYELPSSSFRAKVVRDAVPTREGRPVYKESPGWRIPWFATRSLPSRRTRPIGVAIWLILPVVICLSQRLSHACLSTYLNTVKLRMAH